jgi:glycosyltransferase involved in cell wall biosynthesis
MIGQKGVVIGTRGGGIERHVAELSQRLVKSGHDVTVYARAKYDPEMPDEMSGVHIEYLPTIYSKNLEAIVHTFVSTVKAMRGDFDVMHYHGVGPSTLAWIPRLFAKNKTVITTFHSQDRYHKKWGLIARMYLAFGEWAAVRFPHFCIAVSHTLQVYCRERFNRETVYIPNGAEIKVVEGHEQLERFGLSPKSYILNVGRLVPQKGIHLLIEAFRSVETDKQLVLVGAPSFSKGYYQQLRDLAKGDDRVHFLGYQDGDSLEQLFANAYFYVHPSEAEGLPLAVLEAMSYGLAPLVSDIPANLEALHHTGFTFPSGDISALRESIVRLLQYPQVVTDQSDDVRAAVEVEFNWDMIAQHTESVYVTARH